MIMICIPVIGYERGCGGGQHNSVLLFKFKGYALIGISVMISSYFKLDTYH